MGSALPRGPTPAIAGLARGLLHPSPGVRVLAVESFGERAMELDEARDALIPHLAVEQDRRVLEAIRHVLSLASPVHDTPHPPGSSRPPHPADRR